MMSKPERGIRMELGFWNFSGVWILAFGVSSALAALPRRFGDSSNVCYCVRAQRKEQLYEKDESGADQPATWRLGSRGARRSRAHGWTGSRQSRSLRGLPQ